MQMICTYMVSRSHTLQKCLVTLSSYCKSWILNFSPKKPRLCLLNGGQRKMAIDFTKAIEFWHNWKLYVLRTSHLFYRKLHNVVWHWGKGSSCSFSLRRHIHFSILNQSLACKFFLTLWFPQSWPIRLKSGVSILNQISNHMGQFIS